jgi:MoaA/NifB/PqqE/SkfB family radical SAM enzyme
MVIAKQSPPGLNGIFHPPDEVKAALDEKRALNLVLQYGYGCTLACQMCYAGVGEEMLKMHDRLGVNSAKLSLHEYTQIIGEAKLEGMKSVYVSGEGEPMTDRDEFTELIKIIADHDLTPVVFTNGLYIDEDFARTLCGHNVSVIGKCHSFSPALNNEIVGDDSQYSYSQLHGERVPDHIIHLYNAGLAEKNQLGMNTIVTRKNYAEIEKIWLWCRELGIYPFMEFIVHAGYGQHAAALDISGREREAIHKKVHALDQELGYEYDLSLGPYLGNRTCDSRILLTIDLFGIVRVCACTYYPIGDIREESLAYFVKKHYQVEEELGRRHTNDTVFCECERFNRPKFFEGEHG